MNYCSQERNVDFTLAKTNSDRNQVVISRSWYIPSLKTDIDTFHDKCYKIKSTSYFTNLYLNPVYQQSTKDLKLQQFGTAHLPVGPRKLPLAVPQIPHKSSFISRTISKVLFALSLPHIVHILSIITSTVRPLEQPFPRPLVPFEFTMIDSSTLVFSSKLARAEHQKAIWWLQSFLFEHSSEEHKTYNFLLLCVINNCHKGEISSDSKTM